MIYLRFEKISFTIACFNNNALLFHKIFKKCLNIGLQIFLSTLKYLKFNFKLLDPYNLNILK